MQQELMSTTEIRELLNVGRQRAYQITQHPAFPPPVAELGIGRVWDGAAVRAWAANRAKKTNPATTNPAVPPRPEWPPIPVHLLDGDGFTDVVDEHLHTTRVPLTIPPAAPTQEPEPWDYPDDDPGID